MEDINKTHADRYDFIYLPIDFTVLKWFNILRTNVTLDMLSLISSMLSSLRNSIYSTKGRDGKCLIQKKYL